MTFGNNDPTNILEHEHKSGRVFPLLTHRAVHNRKLRELGANFSDDDICFDRNDRRIGSEESHCGESRRLLNYQIGTLYQGKGTHYVDLYVGSPNPQRQTVIVDTGSSITAFPCEGCTSCGEAYHDNRYFEQHESATYREFNCNECQNGMCQNKYDVCHLQMSYQEGSSWSANESRDLVSIGSPDQKNSNQFSMIFGCQTSITGLFQTQLADGILGMDNDRIALWRQMYDSKVIDFPTFSLCFTHQLDYKLEAGTMTIGTTIPELHKHPIVYAEIEEGSHMFSIHLRKIYLYSEGVESVEELEETNLQVLQVEERVLNDGRVVIDSGTTDTYLNLDIKEEFCKLWKDITKNSFSVGPNAYSKTEFYQLPTIVFQMKGTTTNIIKDLKGTPGSASRFDEDYAKDILVVMPPSHYMQYLPGSKTFIPKIRFEESGSTVLGANFMQGHDIFFDRDNRRIGFAESNCDYKYLVSGKKTLSSTSPFDSKYNSHFVDRGVCYTYECQLITIFTIIVCVSITAALIASNRRRRIKDQTNNLNIDGEISLHEFS